RTVYLLRSLRYPRRTYIGVTGDLALRLVEHNAGCSRSTSRFRPWTVVASIQFADGAAADVFELYLKSGSGQVFARRHFFNPDKIPRSTYRY
ncbi:MAG TPA: GIY-YIG nuclease family protein, partial [Planctomycetota bacterium]|nr:GIY-YIG nuclease family protein [Planctomycetota bacterium]